MQQRSEETHAHILEAASQLFSKAGYEAASVADICQAAGVSKGAFYHHFPSKQALFLELLEGWLSELEAGFNAIQGEIQDVPQAILGMAQMAGEILHAADARLSIFLEFWVQAQRDPEVWQTAIAPYRRYQRFFASLLHKGIADGSLRQVDPELAARTLVSLAVGLLMQALFDPSEADWSQEIQESIQLFLAGLTRRSA